MRNNHIIPLLLFALLLGSCSTTRQLGEGEYLYTGSKVEVEAVEEETPKEVEKQLEKVADQEQNRKLFGLLPLRLWIYNLAGDSVPPSGVRYWLKNKVGEPPVLFKNYTVEATTEEMMDVLHNHGYYRHEIEAERIPDDKKMTLLYQVQLEEPYRFGSLRYPPAADTLRVLMNEIKDGTLIREGAQYSLSTLKQERVRIDAYLKQRGFFYFLPDYLYFQLDTTIESQQVDVTLAVKEEIPVEATRIFHIRRIYVHHDTALNIQVTAPDTVHQQGIAHISYGRLVLEREIINNAIFIEPGEPYRISDYRETLRRLTRLGVFRYVRVRYNIPGDTTGNVLDAHIQLVEQKPKSLRAEVRAVSKSNDFAGPGLDLSYLDRNLDKTATSLQLILNGAFETQVSERGKGLNNFELGANAALDLPRFVAPDFIVRRITDRRFDPKTTIRTGFSHFNRGGLFTVNTFSLSMDYNWQQSTTRNHDLKILSLDYQRLRNISDLPEVTSFLERNYPQAFIPSLRYSYTLNNLLYSRNVNHFWNVAFEPAGSLFGLGDRIITEIAGESDFASEIFGIPYAQYVRVLSDGRLYWNISEKNKLVGRLYLGLGIPYGNAEVLPYKKQFYSGGTTSLRAFPSRSVGPGSYHDTTEVAGGLRLGQTGDIKLEMNLEYRIDLVKYLKGALFVDAGNIWLYNEAENLPGGAFSLSEFPGQLAVGGGVGLRLDVSFFVLRLDVAMPFRKPYLPAGERWVFDEFDPGTRTWRQENLVFNLAIGYPF
jgi:outer membrane protein assembly factor BamA